MDATVSNERYEEFVRLFVRDERALRVFVRSLLPTWTDADEVVQEVALVAWRKFAEFQPGTSFLSWLRVIARFKVLSHRRKLARDRLVFSEELISLLADEAEPEGGLRQQEHDALEGCLAKLPEAQRRLVAIAYATGQPVKDEALRLGVKPGTLYMRLNRIRQQLLVCIQRTLVAEGIA